MEVTTLTKMTAKQSSTNVVVVIVARSDDPDQDQIKKVKEEVREMIDYVKEYNNVEECEQFIRSVRYEYIFLITTPDLINAVIARNIHHIRHVQSIFLFDQHKKFNISDLNEIRKSSFKVGHIHLLYILY